MNEKLKIEYSIYLNFLLDEFHDESRQLSYPLLTYAFDDYFNAKLKFMLVGQETNGWIGKLNQVSQVNDCLTKSLQHYQEFDLGKKYYNSPFWRFNKKLKKIISGNDNMRESIWTNLSKFDYDRKTPDVEILDRDVLRFQLLSKEIEILKPNILIFLVSWKNDINLTKIWDDISIVPIDNINGRYLSKIVSKDLPENSFRTYHPRFLPSRYSKMNENEVVELIEKNLNLV